MGWGSLPASPVGRSHCSIWALAAPTWRFDRYLALVAAGPGGLDIPSSPWLRPAKLCPSRRPRRAGCRGSAGHGAVRSLDRGNRTPLCGDARVRPGPVSPRRRLRAALRQDADLVNPRNHVRFQPGCTWRTANTCAGPADGPRPASTSVPPLELFETVGAQPWADRARLELRASGETARARDLSAQRNSPRRSCRSYGLSQTG